MVERFPVQLYEGFYRTYIGRVSTTFDDDNGNSRPEDVKTINKIIVICRDFKHYLLWHIIQWWLTTVKHSANVTSFWGIIVYLTAGLLGRTGPVPGRKPDRLHISSCRESLFRRIFDDNTEDRDTRVQLTTTHRRQRKHKFKNKDEFSEQRQHPWHRFKSCRYVNASQHINTLGCCQQNVNTSASTRQQIRILKVLCLS